MPKIMEIATPLGEDVLFHSLHGREEISRLSEYQVGLLSPRGDLELNDLLGQKVTVTLALPEDGTRQFTGYVTRIAQQGLYGRYHRYVATVRPWLWFLTRTSDCRVFQEMTVPDIAKAVFADHPTAEVRLELTGTYRTWTYCVQYRETDFNFVSRLLEHEGIYYYVAHVDGQNQLVLTDSYSGHEAFPQYEELPFIEPGRLARPDVEHIHLWELSRQVQPGVYAHTDYDLERPGVSLRTQKALPRPYTSSDYEVYDYPGSYVQREHGEQYAAVRIDEYGSQFELADGATNARGLAVGHLLTLKGHPRPEQNREHLILAATYDLECNDYEALPGPGGASYSCSFVAMSSQQQYRPRRVTPKPFVQGPQTAVVVGPSGEEIYTDKYGRIKVQFHWDRYGTRDEDSSCWVRVSQTWAGKNWGGITIPRIGQEVIVSFLEGDPDQPIITGRVYNADQMPPYELPGLKTQSGIKSRSTLDGTPSNFNEIRFEDKKGHEEVFVQAERNLTTSVKADESRSVGHDRTTTVTHDDKLTIQGVWHTTVTGEVIEKFSDIWQTSAKLGIRVESQTKGMFVFAAEEIQLEVGSSKLNMKKDGTILLKGKNITIDGSDTVTLKPKAISIEGSSSVDLKNAKITLDGTEVHVKGGGASTDWATGQITEKGPGGVAITGATVKVNT